MKRPGGVALACAALVPVIGIALASSAGAFPRPPLPPHRPPILFPTAKATPSSTPTPTATPTPTPTATDTTPSSSSSCGSTTYTKSNGTKYVCSFADDFTGSSLDSSKWVAQQTSISGHSLAGDCWVDDPDNIKVSSGTLKLVSRKESSAFTCDSPYGDFSTQYTSGSVSTRGNFSQTYGRYEFRAKFPDTKTAGSHSALWLYPLNQTYGAWPASGEIDVAEFYTTYPDRVIPYIHYNEAGSNNSPLTNTSCKITDPDNFHTYEMEWTSSKIKVSYDGTTCLEHKIDAASPLTGAAPFDKPFVVYLTQVLGSGSNSFSASSTTLPLTTEIDWVRVWK